MAKRTINAKEILADIKAGMDNAALMEKYHLTDKSLQSVFKKLTDTTDRQIAFLQMVKEAKQRIEQKGFDLSAERQAQASSTNQSEKESEKHLQRGLLMPKRLINTKKILADIKAGTNDAGLMEKYRLTEKGLQSVFKKLVDAGGGEAEGTGEKTILA